MRYLALATDYDGTLAQDGRVSHETFHALERLRESGRRLILVTGRELPDLESVCGRLELFDRVVAENGALLYHPRTREETPLGAPPPPAFVDLLRRAGCTPLGQGRVIVATREPHEKAVLEAIRALGLELQLIFNKGAVMVLPPGVNKETGLLAALDELGLSRHGTVAAGDAENDHAMLTGCECGVAVANALPSLKAHADFVTRGAGGRGVEELIAGLLRDDLRTLLLRRHDLALGGRPGGGEVSLPPYGKRVLVAGSSGSGKRKAAQALIERLMANRYQCCIIDTVGAFPMIPGVVRVGNQSCAPDSGGVLALLERPGLHVAADLRGLAPGDRPALFLELLGELQALRERTGRPHWIVMDEVDQLLPAAWVPDETTLPRHLGGLLMLSVRPERVAPAVLASVDLVLAAGDHPEEALQPFLQGKPVDEPPLGADELLAWSGGRVDRLRLLPPGPPAAEERRDGTVDLRSRGFVFRGPEGKLNLRAKNVGAFLELAEGIDAETWRFHLERGDVARWFREDLKDQWLADEAARVAANARDSRRQLRAAIERRYSLPE